MHDPLVVAFEIRRPWPKPRRGQKYRYWPPIITVWHHEPGGHDSGEICRHYRRTQGADGKWSTKILHGWKFHVHHWRLQVHPLQDLRRWALTRCAWCGGKSRKGDPVNNSHQWDGPRGRWWQGEPGLYHCDCSAIWRAHRSCTCADPLLSQGNYGQCLVCGKGRSFGATELQLEQHRILAAVPAGQRDAAAYQRICDLYAESQVAEKSQP